jgi:hypothetical protein
MPRLLARSLVTLFVATGSSTLFVCVDPVPVHVDEPVSDGGEAGGSGREPDAATDGPPRPCEICMRAASSPGPGCGDQIQACSADPPCLGTLECAFAERCLEQSGQGAIVDCGLPCARDAGLDPASPSATLIFALVTCAQEACGPICRGEVEGGR